MMEHTDMGLHGMVVVGSETTYASHMPMFMSPHDHQVIIQVSLNTAAYHNARRHFGTSALFTLRPGPFPIHRLKPAADGRPTLTEFPAELFFGHFERGGDKLGEVAVNVQQTPVFRHLDLAKKAPQLRYILFGRGADLFLAHEITAAPDFDQLIAVQANTEDSEPAPARAVLLTIPGRENGLDKRLSPGEQVSAAEAAPPSPPATLNLQALTEVYLETSDLAE